MTKDIYYDTVRVALEKDGWTITDDPLTLKVEKRSAYPLIILVNQCLAESLAKK